MKKETTYIYAQAANGMEVRIPADKYESWKKAQDELRAGTRKPDQKTAERLRSLMGRR